MTTSNTSLKESIVKIMHQNKGLDASSIEVINVEDKLFLKGVVSRESEKSLAEQIAFSIPGVVDVVNQLSIREGSEGKRSGKFSGDTDTKIAALMKLTGIPHIAVIEPEVSEKNGTLVLYGIVDAFWKRVYIEDKIKDDFPDLYVENALTVIPPREGDFLPEKNPVREPEMFHRARAMSHKRHNP